MTWNPDLFSEDFRRIAGIAGVSLASDAIVRSLSSIQARVSTLTFDNGLEFARHGEIVRENTGGQGRNFQPGADTSSYTTPPENSALELTFIRFCLDLSVLANKF